MVLSGTLREFILADVMQLLTQQKITGKLILNSNRSEGTIVFKNGSIVAASRETETFVSKLFFYLTTVQDHPRNKVRELFSSYEGNTAELTDLLVKKHVLLSEELTQYATSVTTDIACSLFLWTSGTYHFDSFNSVDHLIPANIELPVENIIMEAMRRIDEWHRMREAITEDTIFVKNGKRVSFSNTDAIFENPQSYYYQQINGTRPVKSLLDDSFQTDYKVYESLYALLQLEYIRPLSESLSRSVHAAINRSQLDKITLQPLVAIGVSIGIIIIIILLSWLYRNILFGDLTTASTRYKNKNSIINAEYHEKNAYRFLRYNSIYGEIPESELTKYASITKRDILFLRIRTKVMYADQKKYDKKPKELYR